MPNEDFWEQYRKETEPSPPIEYSYPWKRLVQITDPPHEDPNLRSFILTGGWRNLADFLKSTGLTTKDLHRTYIQIDDQNYYLPPDTNELVVRVLVIIHGRASFATTLVRTSEIGALIEPDRLMEITT